MNSLVKELQAAPANSLLSTLPPETLALLQPHVRPASHRQGEVLQEADAPVECLIFPTAGLASVCRLSHQRWVDVASVGTEGMIGHLAAFRPHRSRTRAIVRLPMQSLIINASAFRQAASGHALLADLAVAYNETLFSQVEIMASEAGTREIEARLAAYLQRAAECLQTDVLPLTQESLADILTVRRTSVTEAAQKLQEASLISYVRGRIRIIDGNGLARMAHSTAPLPRATAFPPRISECLPGASA